MCWLSILSHLCVVVLSLNSGAPVGAFPKQFPGPIAGGYYLTKAHPMRNACKRGIHVSQFKPGTHVPICLLPNPFQWFYTLDSTERFHI